jgi:hypothetical protein
MKILLYVFEWLMSFFVIFLANYALVWLFKKKFNRVTSIIFSTITLGLLLFLTSHYFISFPKPSLIYLPFLLFLFVLNILRIK